MQFKRTRCNSENAPVVCIQQQDNGIGRIRERHLSEVCLREDIDIFMRGTVVDPRCRVHTTYGHFFDAAVCAGGDMPIGVKQLEVITAHRKIDGIFDIGYLVAKEEIGIIGKDAILPAIHPYRPRPGVQNIKIVVIQHE